ncbi:MAG TPA: serine hydrolase domain-containing protein, partial [Microbacterium sp.]|nr:serine hydrolase domain-containing protein [Microbacterium sp.]
MTDTSRSGIRRRWRRALAVAAVPALMAGLAGCFGAPVPAASGSSSPTGGSTPAASPASDVSEPEIAAIVEDAMADLHLKAAIVQVQVGDETVSLQAFGESMTGVPATTDMHFRNGAVAFEYISNLLLQYVDDGTVSLDDTIDQWAPELPESDKVTLLMLTNQTTGYPDFETDPGWTAAYNADPFHEFTYQERLDYAFSRPMEFAPGTNWSYAHTNFMILGEILSQIGGAPLADLLREKVLDPMGLSQTQSFDSATIPEPVLHAYS